MQYDWPISWSEFAHIASWFGLGIFVIPWIWVKLCAFHYSYNQRSTIQLPPTLTMAWSIFHKKLITSSDVVLTGDYPSRVISCRINVPIAAKLDVAVVSITVSRNTPFVVRTWRTTQQEDPVPSRVSLEVIGPHWDPRKENGDDQVSGTQSGYRYR